MKSASLEKPAVDQVHDRGAEAERQGEDHVHQAQKNRDAPHRMHGEPVDTIGPRDLAVGGLMQEIPADLFDELVAQPGQLRFGVVLVAGGELGGHPGDGLPRAGLGDAVDHLGIIAHQLDGLPPRMVARGKITFDLPEGLFDLVPVIDHGMAADRMNGRHVGGVWTGLAADIPGPVGLADGHLGDGLNQLVHAFALVADGRHHGHPELGGQPGHVDPQAAVPGDIGHVQGQHHRTSDFQQLGGQVEIAFQVGGVHHVHDHVGGRTQQEIPGHEFFLGKSGQAVGAGKVIEIQLQIAALVGALLPFDRHTRVVAHFLVGARQAVEDGRFSRVGIAGHRNGDGLG